MTKLILLLCLTITIGLAKEKNEYLWNEIKSCKDDNNKSIYKYAPNFVEGKTSRYAKFEKDCFIDRKTPFSGYYVNYYKNSKLNTKIPFKDGFKHGVAKQYHRNGRLKFEGRFVHGIPVGEHKLHWRDNKHKVEITTYKDGVKHKFLNHFSDNTKRYIPYDKYGEMVAKDIKNFDKDGRRDCFDDKHILRYKNYECIIDKYSYGKELKAVDNNISSSNLEELLQASYDSASGFSVYVKEFYKTTTPNESQKIFLKVVIEEGIKEQFQRVVDAVIINKDVESIIYKLMVYKTKSKAIKWWYKDYRYDDLVKLISVTLQYKKFHNLKTIRLLPLKMQRNETQYSKKLYKEMQYRYIEFLKNLNGIWK